MAQQKAELEAERLRRQSEASTKEAEEKDAALQKSQAAALLEAAELKSKLAAVTSELEVSKSTAAALEARIQAQSDEVTQYMDQLKAERSGRVTEAEQHAKMREAQQRMVELIQGKDAEKDAKIAELHNAVPNRGCPSPSQHNSTSLTNPALGPTAGRRYPPAAAREGGRRGRREGEARASPGVPQREPRGRDPGALERQGACSRLERPSS